MFWVFKTNNKQCEKEYVLYSLQILQWGMPIIIPITITGEIIGEPQCWWMFKFELGRRQLSWTTVSLRQNVFKKKDTKTQSAEKNLDILL